MRMDTPSNTDERELQLFLYHLTQEILSSRDYSDCNISRICSKFYDTSSYPDKERLRRLIGELKRKLQLDRSHCHQAPEVFCRCNRCKEERSNQQTTPHEQQLAIVPMDRAIILDKCVGTQSLPAFFPETAVARIDEITVPSNDSETIEQILARTKALPQDNSCRCNRCMEEYEQKLVPTVMLDKGVGTQSRSAFFPESALVRIDESVPLLESQQTYTTVTPCSASAGTYCSSVYSVQRRESNESDTLIEQILMRHKALPQDSSSNALLRMAAADRMICDACHGRCPLQRCQTLTGAGVPGPSCARTGTTRCDLNRPLPKKTCKCPLKQCNHFAAGGGGAGGCSGGCVSDAPILRQDGDESITPPVTCCGTRRKRRKQPLVACRERSNCRKEDSRKK